MSVRRLSEKTDALLARERGTIVKSPGGRAGICLVYPNTYHVGMSNLGFHGVYTLLNEEPDVFCERAFLPDEEDLAEYARTDTELFSFETKRPLGRFNIVAFSVPFENDYPNIPKILSLAHIPPRAAERGSRHPLVIMGGVCAFFNPEPVAEFFDLCFIGEAEEMLGEFLAAYRDSTDKTDLIRRAAEIPGVYAPGLYTVHYGPDGLISGRISAAGASERIERRFVRDLNASRLGQTILTPETEFSDMRLFEAMRGCPWSCRFCVTGYVYNPPRRREPELLAEAITSSGAGKIGLIGPSLSDYHGLSEILCLDGVDFSITSLRASPRSAELIRFLRKHRSVSIAPEAGTPRLRTAIDKRITEEDIVETSRLILSEGVENLRLYFMIGLPTEGEDDIEGLISLVRKIRSVSPRGNLVLTVSTFVPKPFTPFQWHPMAQMAIVKERLQKIKKALIPLKGVKVFHDVQKYAFLQALLARGDRRVSAIIEAIAGNIEWQRACREASLDPGFYLSRERAFDEILPWDFINSGTARERLWDEYLKALATVAEGG